MALVPSVQVGPLENTPSPPEGEWNSEKESIQ